MPSVLDRVNVRGKKLQDLPYGLSGEAGITVNLTVVICRIFACHLRYVMANAASSPRRLEPWRELYNAALFETDQERIPARIVDAEQAIVARARELFAAGNDTIEEDQALDDALYALRALQNCLRMRAAAA
jgi:hypothetical protein